MLTKLEMTALLERWVFVFGIDVNSNQPFKNGRAACHTLTHCNDEEQQTVEHPIQRLLAFAPMLEEAEH